MKLTGKDFPTVFYEVPQKMEVTSNCQARNMEPERRRNRVLENKSKI